MFPVAAIIIMTVTINGIITPRNKPRAIQRIGASGDGGLRGGGPSCLAGSPGLFISTAGGGESGLP